ncbi:MAG: DNA cytosine methyltransferase [Paracoccus sp.]|nr:DNA cytosine methyltransferase [Paracoccus sp. (in: a-proteobacteria)]
MGLKEAGIHIIRAYDSLEAAVRTYRQNVGTEASCVDLRSQIFDVASELRELRIDMLVGGAPCQDYSPAGKRIKGKAAALTHVLTILAQHLRPEWVMFENVPDAKGAQNWKDMVRSLRRSGYGITQLVIDCSLYGVPQSRKRLFVIGRLGERDGFMDPAIHEAAAARPMVMRDLFGESSPPYVFRHARYPDRRQVYSDSEPHPTIRDAIRPAPRCSLVGKDSVCLSTIGSAGEASLNVCFKSGKCRGHGHACARRHPRDPVPPFMSRRLTLDELARAQGFPAIWDWSGVKVEDRKTMIANAVPAPTGAILGRLIIERHLGLSQPQVPEEFRKWLARGKVSEASIRNIVYRINKARRWLRGRTFRRYRDEVAALGRCPQYRRLADAERSNYATALKRLWEWEVVAKRGNQRSYRSRVPPKGKRNKGRKR